MPEWRLLHPEMTQEALGYLPLYLSDSDQRPAAVQFQERYGPIGGGWTPTKQKIELKPDGLHFPGDPVMPPLAETKLGDETIRFYDCSWVAIIQPDGSYEIARID